MPPWAAFSHKRGGRNFENNIPTFYDQDRWKTFVYEQEGLEIDKKRDFHVKNWDFVKIILKNHFFSQDLAWEGRNWGLRGWYWVESKRNCIRIRFSMSKPIILGVFDPIFMKLLKRIGGRSSKIPRFPQTKGWAPFESISKFRCRTWTFDSLGQEAR